MQNPFTSRNMIKEADAFIGRRAEIAQIFANLENFQNTSVVGERRFGKSSLLWRVSRPEVYSAYNGTGGKPLLVLFFDLQKVATVTPESFFKLLASGLAAQLPPGDGLDPKEFEDATEYFDALVEHAWPNYRLVICLDEFETVAANDRFDNRFLLYLRHFANLGKIAYITSSREPLEHICKGTDHLQGSDFWNIFIQPPLSLGLLTRGEAIQLITRPSRAAGLEFDPEEVEAVLRLAGCQPLFLQIACFHVFEVKRQKQDAQGSAHLTPIDWAAIDDNVMMGVTPHCDHLWERMSAPQRQVLTDPAVAGDDAVQDAVRHLLRRGLLQSGTPPQPFSEAFARCVREKAYAERRVAAPAVVGAGAVGVVAPPPAAAVAAPSPPLRPGPAPQLPSAKLEIWIGRNSEVLVDFNGPYRFSQICPNRARFDANTIKRFDARTRNLPQNDNWRIEKQEIGQDVCELFGPIPEIAQIYSASRAAVEDERLLITFRCPQEMLSFPFEFINTLSVVDEAPRHLVLTHPTRRSILGLRSKKGSLSPTFWQDPNVRILLVSSNVSGPVAINRKTYQLPAIAGVVREVEALRTLIERRRATGDAQCAVECRHGATRDEIVELIESDEFDIIHFSGHGMYADSPEGSCLFFRDGVGNGIATLSANELNALVERTRLKFIYLSCCQGAMTGASDALLNNDFLGIAHSLVVGAIPSVLSMRWPLSDDVAVLLAEAFYQELFRGRGLELALFRARKIVQARMPNDYNWLSPVLVVQGD